ncbi:MAG: glycosyltransferase [Prochlorococcaceae cyanobacterium ETNP7_MAG_30]|nr:glycosyltransferase [Prochlorococcaceae cyanobacterium ETNP7_MAG_30]
MLSLSMIVRNEESRLGSCLASVKGFVDEIVVLDTGSTDSTVAVAKAAGAQVEQLPWPGDFAPARNAALNLIKGDWVLVLDADEQLRAEVIPDLIELMAQQDVLVVNLLRFEQGATMAPYSSVSRLFRRHQRIRWSRPYHSMIDDSVREILNDEPDWRIVDYVEPALLHEGYRPDLLQRSNKSQRLRIAMEAWLAEHPYDPYACAKLGALEVAEGQKERGIKLLRQGLEQNKETTANPIERYELLLHLGIALCQDDPKVAIKAYREALDLPMDIRASLGARLNLAGLLMQQEQLDEAIALTTTATQQAPEVAIAWYNLGLMQRRRGDLVAALQAYEQSKQLNPEHAETHQNQAVAMLVAGDINGARNNFNKAIALLHDQGRNEESERLRNQVAGMVKLDQENR